MCRYNIVGRLALEEIFASNELNWNLFACNFQTDGSNFMHIHTHSVTHKHISGPILVFGDLNFVDDGTNDDGCVHRLNAGCESI